MKLTKILIIGAMVCMGALMANAQSFSSQNFINGYNLYITNGATATYGSSNVYGSGWVVTNAITYQTNGTTIYTNYNGTSSYSAVLVTNTSWATDVPLWANRDGSALTANISVDVVGKVAGSTNILTFAIYAVPNNVGTDKITTYPASTANNSFSFAITCTGTTPVVLATNLPTAFLQGCKSLRLQTITPSNAGYDANVVGVWLNGFKPAGAE
jgi:hypothetical protein